MKEKIEFFVGFAYNCIGYLEYREHFHGKLHQLFEFTFIYLEFNMHKK
jgi:hypothetical protein